MQTRRYVVPATVLLALLLLWGCSKKPEQTATATSSDNQSAATQPAADGATPDDGASNTAPASSANAPAASSTAGTSQQVSSAPPLVRLQERLSSASAVPGERFEAVIDEPIVVDDRTVIAVGTPVTGHVIIARRSGRLHHPGELGLTLDSVLINNQQVPLTTSHIIALGASHKKRNLGWIGGGTGGGAIIGALAAGGKGALIGSGIGAVAGTTTAFVTGKKDVGFAAERRLRFRLTRDISLA